MGATSDVDMYRESQSTSLGTTQLATQNATVSEISALYVSQKPTKSNSRTHLPKKKWKLFAGFALFLILLPAVWGGVRSSCIGLPVKNARTVSGLVLRRLAPEVVLEKPFNLALLQVSSHWVSSLKSGADDFYFLSKAPFREFVETAKPETTRRLSEDEGSSASPEFPSLLDQFCDIILSLEASSESQAAEEAVGSESSLSLEKENAAVALDSSVSSASDSPPVNESASSLGVSPVESADPKSQIKSQKAVKRSLGSSSLVSDPFAPPEKIYTPVSVRVSVIRENRQMTPTQSSQSSAPTSVTARASTSVDTKSVDNNLRDANPSGAAFELSSTAPLSLQSLLTVSTSDESVVQSEVSHLEEDAVVAGPSTSVTEAASSEGSARDQLSKSNKNAELEILLNSLFNIPAIRGAHSQLHLARSWQVNAADIGKYGRVVDSKVTLRDALELLSRNSLDEEEAAALVIVAKQCLYEFVDLSIFTNQPTEHMRNARAFLRKLAFCYVRLDILLRISDLLPEILQREMWWNLLFKKMHIKAAMLMNRRWHKHSTFLVNKYKLALTKLSEGTRLAPEAVKRLTRGAFNPDYLFKDLLFDITEVL